MEVYKLLADERNNFHEGVQRTQENSMYEQNKNSNKENTFKKHEFQS